MRQLFLGIIAALVVLIGSVPVAAGQNNAAVQEKPASSTPQPVTCDALLQHPLAWWLSSMPTPAERDQLAACLAGSSTRDTSGFAHRSDRPFCPADVPCVDPPQQATASPSVSPAPSAAAQDKPTNWNTLFADQQTRFASCRTLNGAAYYTCMHPDAEATSASTVSNDSAYQRYLTTKLRKKTDNGMRVTQHFNRAEWETYCVRHRNDSNTCQGWRPGAIVAPAQTAMNSSSTKPANRNTMNAEQQQTWNGGFRPVSSTQDVWRTPVDASSRPLHVPSTSNRSLAGTSNRIGPFTFYSDSNGVTGTANRIGSTTFYNYSDGVSGTSNRIGSTILRFQQQQKRRDHNWHVNGHWTVSVPHLQ